MAEPSAQRAAEGREPLTAGNARREILRRLDRIDAKLDILLDAPLTPGQQENGGAGQPPPGTPGERTGR